MRSPNAPWNLPEFIHLVSSQANEICDKESKKTISPEHIITALEVRSLTLYLIEQADLLAHPRVLPLELESTMQQQLEFNHFIPEIKEVFEEHRTQAKVSHYLFILLDKTKRPKHTLFVDG